MEGGIYFFFSTFSTISKAPWGGALQDRLGVRRWLSHQARFLWNVLSQPAQRRNLRRTRRNAETCASPLPALRRNLRRNRRNVGGAIYDRIRRSA